MIRAIVFSVGAAALLQPAIAQESSRAKLDAMIAAHAQANGVPVALVHRVVIRESRYRPGVIGKGGAMGLMQIKTATARGLGYSGTARGLLDPETNLTYAVRYLAGAYRVAGGNPDRAVMHYARGYYYAAKRKGMLDDVSARTSGASRRGAGRRAEAAAAVRTRAATPPYDFLSRRDEFQN
ncbi:MAG: transglycosylase SLT domain-containing protein [Rhizobiales bacterium]|nr:transglycosylase SLT domain-containing protein [Hyphomicrobiales bacterium]